MKFVAYAAAVSSLALLSAVVVSSPVSAQDEAGVLKGADAFGDYTKDKPGVKRHILDSDLQPPNVTASDANAPEYVKMPEGALPKVPDGFKVEMVASGITSPRAIRFAPNGDLFVANSDEGSVLVLHFDQSGKAQQSTYIEKLNQPYGIAFYPADKPQWVYIAESDGLKRYPYKEGDLKAEVKADGPDQGETILTGIPGEHHWTRDVTFSADGKTLFYSVGTGSNVGLDGTMETKPEKGSVADWVTSHPLGLAWGEEEGRATVRAYDPDGKNERIYATGLRNCAGMTLQPVTGKVWCVVNERDELGDNVPFEYATAIKDGAFYGWPWYYIGDNPDPRWAAEPRTDLKGHVTSPDVLFQAHSAPLNIAFYASDAWGPDYQGSAFVTFHGSWNRGTRTGYKVVKMDFDAAGTPTGTYEDFMTGFVIDPQNVWGRPVGVAVSPKGDVFVSEDGSGTIWKVSKE